MEKWRRLSIGRVTWQAGQAEGNSLIENRVIWSKVVLASFFSFLQLRVISLPDRWLTTSSIECPFPSFISGNYHRLPSGKTVSGTILIVPTYRKPSTFGDTLSFPFSLIFTFPILFAIPSTSRNSLK